MRNRYSRWICLIIAVFVLASGFGLKKELPISVFCLTEEKELILSHQDPTFSTFVYAAEISRTSEDSVENIIGSCSSNKKRENSNDDAAFYSYHSLLLGETVYVVSEQALSLEHCKETIVTQYIHALDGKKRV